MARMNIDIPDDVKERIDAIGDRVDWSDVAREAFERQIVASSFPEEPSMEDVIARLRASKKEWEADHKAEGQADGRDWAMKNAEYPDLKVLAEFEYEDEEDLYQQIDDHLRNKTTGWDDRSFWESCENNPPSDDYVVGFLEGVTEVWNKVRSRL